MPAQNSQLSVLRVNQLTLQFEFAIFNFDEEFVKLFVNLIGQQPTKGKQMKNFTNFFMLKNKNKVWREN